MGRKVEFDNSPSLRTETLAGPSDSASPTPGRYVAGLRLQPRQPDPEAEPSICLLLAFVLANGHVLPEHLVDTALVAAPLGPKELQDVFVEANGDALLLRRGIYKSSGLKPVLIKEVRVRIALHGLTDFFIGLLLESLPVRLALHLLCFI